MDEGVTEPSLSLIDPHLIPLQSPNSPLPVYAVMRFGVGSMSRKICSKAG